MKQHQRNQTISVLEGFATLENGQLVDLESIQLQLNRAFVETGENEYAAAASELAKLTGFWQGPHGEIMAIEDSPH